MARKQSKLDKEALGKEQEMRRQKKDKANKKLIEKMCKNNDDMAGVVPVDKGRVMYDG